MHIVLVSQWYPPEWGGIAVYNQIMARAYTELGHKVTIVTGRSQNGSHEGTEEAEVIYEIGRLTEPYYLRRFPHFGGHARSIRHLLYSLKVLRALRSINTKRPVDIVQFAEVNAEGWASLLGPHGPTVVRCHTPHFLLRQTVAQRDFNFDTQLIERAERYCMRRADAVTAPSLDLAHRIDRELSLRGRVKVIPNPISVDEFAPISTQASEHRPNLTILYVGRLSREKGVFVLAEALARLKHQSKTGRWRAVFAGDDRTGEEGVSNRQQLEGFFESEGLSQVVEFTGPVSQGRLLELYRSSDICVVPSLLYESFSYTSAQAMSCGVPVVATTSGGIPEVVLDGVTGLLIPLSDSEALAEALMQLLSNSRLRKQLGYAARERVVTCYAAPLIAEAQLGIYRELVDHPA